MPNEFNKHDKQTYARYYPRRMAAEVLFDAVCQVTDSPAAFGGLPQDRHAPKRAIMLPDESFPSYFLDVFGRPQRISACECERVSEANLAQALHLLNSDEVQDKLTRAGGRADVLAKDARPTPRRSRSCSCACSPANPPTPSATPPALNSPSTPRTRSWPTRTSSGPAEHEGVPVHAVSFEHQIRPRMTRITYG